MPHLDVGAIRGALAPVLSEPHRISARAGEGIADWRRARLTSSAARIR